VAFDLLANHELRMKDASGQYRVIYFMKSKDAIYVLHGFKKKTQHIELRVRKTIDERLKQI
jgi:phage-related protein